MILLISAMGVMAATPSRTESYDTASSGYSTYIIAFNGEPGQMSAMEEEQVTSLIDSYNGEIVYRYSTVLNGMAVTIPDNKVSELKALKNVRYIEKDQEVKVLLDKAVPQIGANDVWVAGYTGKGVKVCVVDTGIDGGHPDLNGNKIVGWVDYVNGRTSPYDDHGHGTHCSSTIAGTGSASNGKYKGVAPEASLMGAKVLSSSGSGSSSNIIKGIDWAVKNGANVISMSLGSTSHSQASDDAVNNAVKAGVTVVVAAGNSGPNAKTIACPGDCPSALTVGASDRNDVIASFSSRGPTYDGRIKPDVTNMGVGLVAARATGTSGGKPVDQYYTAMSGTSMATPMTAGTVALLLQAKPGMTPAQVKEALTKTAKQLGNGIPNNDYGYGRVQAMAALEYVKSGKIPSPTPTPTPDPSATPTPTISPSPTAQPGSYSVKIVSMFAKYNGKSGRMDQFSVIPGTTITQGAMLGNVGGSADSYTLTVNGISQSWYRIAGYYGETIQPNSAASLNIYITPPAGTATGAYKFTVTARSNSDPSVSHTVTYTVNVQSQSASPTPTPSTSPVPTTTPLPPGPGNSFSGTASTGKEYYVYMTPTQAGTISASIKWSTGDDLNMYLYDPAGRLVAKSETRYTTSESVQYAAPSGGNYLLKVTADRSYNQVTFTGSSSSTLETAYVKTGVITGGQVLSLPVYSSGKNINARLTWTWSFYTPGLMLYDANGVMVARGVTMMETMTSGYSQLDYKPVAGTYNLKIDNSASTGSVSYKLISPYQL